MYIPVLTYHHVSDDIDYYTAVSTLMFKKQIDAITREFKLVNLSETIDSKRATFPSNAAALTFDDGYVDNLTALQLLAKLDISTTLFIPTGTIGKDNKWNHKAPYVCKIVDVADIKRIIGLGHNIGSHGRYHQSLPKLDDQELFDEIAMSKVDLQKISDSIVDVFCYPFGAYNNRVKAMVSGHYSAAVATTKTADRMTADRLSIPRLSVNADTSIDTILEYLHGG